MCSSSDGLVLVSHLGFILLRFTCCVSSNKTFWLARIWIMDFPISRGAGDWSRVAALHGWTTPASHVCLSWWLPPFLSLLEKPTLSSTQNLHTVQGKPNAKGLGLACHLLGLTRDAATPTCPMYLQCCG